MMGVCNRLNTAQTAWDRANVTSGAGTDSIMWSYAWGTDSLILGENFVCAMPLEVQAAITNNLGLGTPFAGNLEVYPVYRVEPHGGIEESPKPQASSHKLEPTIVRGVLVLGTVDSRQSTGYRAAPSDGGRCGQLLDAAGRKVMDLRTGANDVSGLAPGVFFVRAVSRKPSAVSYSKVVVTR